MNRCIRILDLIIGVPLRIFTLRFNSNLAKMVWSMRSEDFMNLVFCFMDVYSLLANEISLETKLETLLALILNSSMPRNRRVDFKLISLSKKNWVMRVMFTVLKRFFPFQQTLHLQRSIDSSVFNFELSVLFVHPTIRMNLRFSHLLSAHNRT